MTRAAFYLRVSTVDQHPETQLLDLRQLAAQRGFEVVAEYTDRISGAKARRPGLDDLMRDAKRGRFDVVLVWACDRIARSTRHFLEVLDELNRLGIEFVSFRESIDTGGPLGRAIIVIIGAIAELERSLIVERVRAGMRRARLEGTHIGRRPLDLDREAIFRDRKNGQSLGELARNHNASRATIHRVLSGHTKEKVAGPKTRSLCLSAWPSSRCSPSLYVSRAAVRYLPSPPSAKLAGPWIRSWPAIAASKRPWRSTVAFSTTPTSKSMPFQKASKNPPANSHKINSRISPIRLFLKVYLQVHRTCQRNR